MLIMFIHLTDKKVLNSPAQDCPFIDLLFFIPQGRYYSIQIYQKMENEVKILDTRKLAIVMRELPLH